ncbi:MAG: phospho-sugar mutase [Dysgonamonadaceae bacterium]|jgi:phosphoglucomutase|nr:phospho-sugar mutase [Dysgonamonadaceae bacterium]
MNNDQMLNDVQAKAVTWLSDAFDEKTRTQVKDMMDHHPAELTECFYRSLEFGTGGLRGLMGVGANRMNIYTVGMATQGLCNYLKKNFAALPRIKVAIAHDSRNNSRLFAETAAGIFAANGIKVYLFEALRPTPELSFTIRHFGCQSGVVITASHNPKEYNGYKAYWDDGGQVIPPHDKGIIDEVSRTAIESVKFHGPKELITIIGKEVDDAYTDAIAGLTLSPDVIARHKNLKIVYTPIHGTGVVLVPMALTKKGFTNIYHILEQDVSDGNFPTVKSPNPEEPAALNLAMQKAKEVDADIVMGTDPDADRVGIAVKNGKDEWEILNGNQAAAVLVYYLIKRWGELGKLKGKEYIVKTIVTTELLAEIAHKSSVSHYDVLTGFKWIADIIRRNEGKAIFIGGGEESYGYLCGEFVRDKDAVMSCSFFAEIAAWAKDQGKTVFDILLDIYVNYNFYKETGISVMKTGKSGAEKILAMMEGYRHAPPKTIAGSPVIKLLDYEKLIVTDMTTGKTEKIDMPKSDVLQFLTADGTKVSVRPSGTEPKIKYYISVKEPLPSVADYAIVNRTLDAKIKAIVKEFGL